MLAEGDHHKSAAEDSNQELTDLTQQRGEKIDWLLLPSCLCGVKTHSQPTRTRRFPRAPILGKEEKTQEKNKEECKYQNGWASKWHFLTRHFGIR